MFNISRKLVTAVAAMVTITVLVLGSAHVGNVPTQVLLTSIACVAGLGGFNVWRQASIDSKQVETVVDPKTVAVIEGLTKALDQANVPPVA